MKVIDPPPITPRRVDLEVWEHYYLSGVLGWRVEVIEELRRASSDGLIERAREELRTDRANGFRSGWNACLRSLGKKV